MISTGSGAQPRTFYLHYNKPASLKAQRPQLSVHWRDTCYIGDAVVCNVPTASRNRKTQPRVVMVGRASAVRLDRGVITIEP